MELAEADLEAASRQSIAHGILLAIRYVLFQVPWISILSSSEADGSHDERPAFKALLRRLLSLVHKVAHVTLPVLAMYQDAFIGTESTALKTVTALFMGHRSGCRSGCRAA